MSEKLERFLRKLGPMRYQCLTMVRRTISRSGRWATQLEMLIWKPGGSMLAEKFLRLKQMMYVLLF